MAEQFVKVRPPQSDAYLANPHKGCCTFQHFNGDELYPGMEYSEEGPVTFPPPITLRTTTSGEEDLVVKGYLPTTVAYCRWFWALMEPRKGQFDFSVIEKSLAVCKERGQKLAFRPMAFGGFLSADGAQVVQRQVPDGTLHVPGLGAHGPLHARAKFAPVSRALGGFHSRTWPAIRRSSGCGELHLRLHRPLGRGRCRHVRRADRQVCRRILRRFPAHAEDMVSYRQPIADRAGQGSAGGWRADSFGDLKDTGSDAVTRDVSWNHHYDAYPQQIFETGMTDAWKTGPVFFEVGPSPMWWYKQGYDLDFIIQQGKKFHMTYFMPKYCHARAVDREAGRLLPGNRVSVRFPTGQVRGQG